MLFLMIIYTDCHLNFHTLCWCGKNLYDGTNHYLYRVFKDNASETQIENLQNKIYFGKATRSDITRVTKRLGDEISKVYGIDLPFAKEKPPREPER